MDNMDWLRVCALYQKRTGSGEYLWDTNHRELSEVELGRLIIDSIYADVDILETLPMVLPESYLKFGKRMRMLPVCLKQQIKKHYALRA